MCLLNSEEKKGKLNGSKWYRLTLIGGSTMLDILFDATGASSPDDSLAKRSDISAVI